MVRWWVRPLRSGSSDTLRSKASRAWLQIVPALLHELSKAVFLAASVWILEPMRYCIDTELTKE